MCKGFINKTLRLHRGEGSVRGSTLFGTDRSNS